MTGSFILLTKLNMYVLLSAMYLYGITLLVSVYNRDLYNKYNLNLIYALPLIFLTGLPPLPLFFCKAWSMGYLIKASWGVGIFILIFCNSLLLVTYLTTTNENETKEEGRVTNFLIKTKLDFMAIAILMFLFLLTPYSFILF